MNKDVIDFINKNDNFVVTSHVSPDGDNLGSTISMYLFLKKIGKNVQYILDDSLPKNVSFLVDENIHIENSKDLKFKIYNLVTMDCGDKKRICVDEEIVKNANKLINIDHHISNDYFGDFNLVDGECSSTCEMVFNLLMEYEEICNTKINEKVECNQTNKEQKEYFEVIDECIATSLYTGLVTDTGNFMYSSSKPSSLLMAKTLLERNANKELIIEKIYQSNSFSYYKLLGEALNSLEVYDEKIALIPITIEMMKKHNISYNDCDGVSSYTRDIEGIEVGILIKQKSDDEFKISLRSKSYVDVSEICCNLGGGGHKRASGCLIVGNLEEAKAKIIEEVRKYIK